MLLMNLSAKAASNTGRSVSSDYYGGAYLNDDGNLVVCVTNEYDTDSNAIQAYTNNSEITTKVVEHTYTELKHEQDLITEVYMLCSDTSAEKNSAESKSTLLEVLLSSFRGTYIDEERNTLVVMIAEITDEKIKVFQNVFSNAEFLEFVEGYTVTTTASSWNPGRRIYAADNSYCSTGYPVYFKNTNGVIERGFISAGHGFSSGAIVKTNSTTNLGTCVASVFSRSTDAALIRIANSNYGISEITYYGNTTLSSYGYTAPAQGTTIYKEGTTSGRTMGSVVSTSTTVNYIDDRVIITDVLMTTALNLPGDSGGVAYTSYGSVIGSMSGSSFEGELLTEESFLYSYICKIENAMDALNCSLWPCPGDECEDPDCICRN